MLMCLTRLAWFSRHIMYPIALVLGFKAAAETPPDDSAIMA